MTSLLILYLKMLKASKSNLIKEARYISKPYFLIWAYQIQIKPIKTHSFLFIYNQTSILIQNMQKPFYLIISLILLSSLTAVKSAGLNTMKVYSYDEVYSDRGTGADQDLSVWRPQVPPGWYNLGYIFTNDRSPPGVGTTVVQENTPGMLAAPVDWQFDWNDRGSGGDVDGSIWTPICPAGYRAIGSVAIHIPNGVPVSNANFPDIRCVNCGLVELSSLSGVRWTDNGSGADFDAIVQTVADSEFFRAGYPDKVYRLANNVDKPLMKRYQDGKNAALLQFAVGDFNGDGKDDFISQEKGNQWANLFLRTANEDRFNKVILPKAFDLDGDTTKIFVGDWNGDGQDDFMRVKNGQWVAKVFISRGDGTSFDSFDLPYAYAMDGAQINVLVGDFNGDGRDDFMRQEKGAFDDDATYTAQIMISNGDGTFNRIELPEEYELQDRYADLYVGDFNGDGKDDFLRIEKDADVNTGTLFLTTGVNSDNTIGFSQIHFPVDFLKLQPSNTLLVGDFNGDGQDDFIRQVAPQYLSQVSNPQDTVSLFLSRLTKDTNLADQTNITSLFQEVSLPADLINDLQAKNNVVFYVGDFNGDGKDDIIRQPTNLRWDTSVANIFLATEGNSTEGRPITFTKIQPTRLRGDYTPLSIGDFNGDGRSDILKQEKGTWGDEKFSLPTLFLAVNDTNFTVLFDKIYYREELDANLIKDADSVKADLGKKLEYDLVNLASVMGYRATLFEDSYDVVKDTGNIVIKEKSGACDGVSIKLTNWTFAFGDILWGEALRVAQTIIQTDSGTLDNRRNSQSSQQTAQFSREFTTSVDKYDLTTFTWNVGAEAGVETEVSAGFAKVTTTFKINFSIGEDKQTGTVSASGETRTLSSSATTTVPPRTLQKYLVKVFGIQTNFDTSVVQVDARFSVEFSGPLRSDNYYNKQDASESTENVVFSLGTSSNPFYRALSDQVQRSRNGRWDWNSLTSEHPEAYEWIRTLTNKGSYSTSQYFTMEAVQGTEVSIEFQPTEND